MAIVDCHGLPLVVTTHAANHHEVTLVQLTFDFYTIEARPKNLIGDRAYDSNELDAETREQGTEMTAPHRTNRVRKKTSGRPPAAPLNERLTIGPELAPSGMTCHISKPLSDLMPDVAQSCTIGFPSNS